MSSLPHDHHSHPLDLRAAVAAERLRWWAARMELPAVYSAPSPANMRALARLLDGEPAAETDADDDGPSDSDPPYPWEDDPRVLRTYGNRSA